MSVRWKPRLRLTTEKRRRGPGTDVGFRHCSDARPDPESDSLGCQSLQPINRDELRAFLLDGSSRRKWPRFACRSSLALANLISGGDIHGFSLIPHLSGGWRAVYGADGVSVAAPGRAAERGQSQSLQQVRLSLGDGPSLRGHGAVRRLSGIHSPDA
jgi:hypothetical protein